MHLPVAKRVGGVMRATHLFTEIPVSVTCACEEIRYRNACQHHGG